MKRYRRKNQTNITAVRVSLDTLGFTYEKWGGTQRCKAGDWLACNDGDTYTIDADTFNRTYESVSPGVFRKCVPVWAVQAVGHGWISTKEGQTEYHDGDMLVHNKEDLSDGYAISSKTKFDSLYEEE